MPSARENRRVRNTVVAGSPARTPEGTRAGAAGRPGRDWAAYATVVALYGVSRAVGAVFIVLGARRQVPVDQLPTGYHSTVPSTLPAGYRDVVTNWDGQWYWDIVLHGYPTSAVDAAGEPVQTSLAFFPLYPTLVRALTAVTGLGFDVVAPTLSLVLGAAAFLVLFVLLRDVVGRTRALLGLAVLTCSVTAPVLQTAYTESLALLLVATPLLLLRRRRYLWAVLPGRAARPHPQHHPRPRPGRPPALGRGLAGDADRGHRPEPRAGRTGRAGAARRPGCAARHDPARDGGVARARRAAHR